MKPNNTFLNLPKNFWASVRLISQAVGYTEKSTGQNELPRRKRTGYLLARTI